MGIWEMPPGDFYQMTMQEWWWVYDAKVGSLKKGSLTESQAQSLYNLLE